ncbi:Uncharacterized membrane protein, DUF2068 family [Nakamurella panacisegetis]|uniref:Uncharacterized membrane protein, DUF2068 family n=1 Tax=Nakamurella panacisegetis TaxID=1090615 RepID=A0A1H0RZK8_9ACTN|nr:DUF2127 domain-containing protein [Nakamurella panacisegetis]SDP34797.1 Uncharacterized membrane protein, DUF2068 family [Nakamurella panacisegetis]
MDWNLNTCARRGHETYAPDEPGLRDRLCVQTPAGEAWRCLRCATYVVGAPKGSGKADDAPEVPRGRLLRDRRLMRLLAAERVIRGLGLAGLAVLVFVFRKSRGNLQDSFNRDLPLLRPLADQIGWNIDDSKIVRGINDVFSLSERTLTWIAVGLIAYAVLQFVEGTGLWLMKRWGEYFAVVATSIFLPLEVYELTERVTWLRIVLFLVNVAAVVWLIWSKRLFGFRGGGRAFHAEHHAESLMTVERAAAAETAVPAV